MKSVIIEDEKSNSDRLTKLLQKTASQIKVIATLESIEDSVEWFRSNDMPDLIFMDVQLSDGLCFEIFNFITIDTPIIFTTAYDEYAINAFKVNSVDYLLKPISTVELERAIEKFHKYFSNNNSGSLLNLFKDMQENKPIYKTRFLVKQRQTLVSFAASEVALFIVSSQIVNMYTMDGKKFIMDSFLDDLEKSLDPKIFFRVSRQCLININSILNLKNYPGARLQILVKPDINAEIIVSREKVTALKKWLSQ